MRLALVTSPLPKLTASGTPMAPDIAGAGPPIPPIERLRHMSATQWEEFVLEWAQSLTAKYARVERRSGAGDKGLDIVGFPDAKKATPWDNFQCKHYDHPLAPNEIWTELGKLAVHSFAGEYELPRAYAFVAPQGAGNSLQKLLTKPDELRAGLIAAWPKHCVDAITSTGKTKLTKELREHIVKKIDFSIFSAPSPLVLIQQHATTPYHVFRFGGSLPLRAPAPQPPASPAPSETNYVRALLDAYEDKLGVTLSAHSDVSDAEVRNHFSRSRREFYSAESLREFSRDNLPPDTFNTFLDEVDNGIADVAAATHSDGYARVLAVVQHAKALQLTANALIARTTQPDRGGMCHQLANEKRVQWRKK